MTKVLRSGTNRFMFGRGKERGPKVPQKDLVRDVIDTMVEAHDNNAQAFAKLPDYLIARFGDLRNLISEYQVLQSTPKAIIPRAEQQVLYAQRIMQLENRLIGMREISDAIRLGYEPYKFPLGDFYAGSVNGQPVKTGMEDGFNIPRRLMVPMSEEVLAKYERARKDGTFDVILAISKDKGIFEIVSSLNSEYVLVGFVPTGDGPVFYSEEAIPRDGLYNTPSIEALAKARNITAFLIADSAQKKPNLAIAS